MHDDHLRLIFTCCHPALAPDAQVALTLRLIGGLSTEEVAHAFFLQPTTLAQRIIAKVVNFNRKISVAFWMESVNSREIIHWNRRVSEHQIVDVAKLPGDGKPTTRCEPIPQVIRLLR